MTKKEADKFLNILHTIPTKIGWFPKIDDIAKKLNLPKYKASKILKELNELGMLSRTGNWYNFINPIDEITDDNLNIDDKEIIIQSSNLPENWQKSLDKFNEEKLGDIIAIPITKNYYIPFIRYSMLILGILSEIISSYYTYIWAHETLNIYMAIVLSSIIALFSTVSFETMIAILKNKNSNWTKYLLGILFLLIWLLITVFSMSSTIAGQFNLYVQKQKMNIEISSSKENNSILYSDIINKENELMGKRLLLIDEMKPMLSIADSMKNMEQFFTENKRSKEAIVYFDNQYRLVLANRKLEIIDNELKEIRKNKEILINKGNIVYTQIMNIKNFYSWLGTIFNISDDLAQFWMIVLPAILLDLISPVAIAVFLFLKKSKDDI